MKTEKNNLFWKKFNFQFFKSFLWISLGFLFINISFLIPSKSDSIVRELLVFFFIATVVNFHTLFVFPSVYNKNKLVYICTLIFSILLCVVFEMLLFLNIFSSVGYHNFNNREFYFTVICFISLRDIALFAFFIWIEYFNRIILLYYKQEQIHKKEIALLFEKQDFEKKFSRKKILPHYLFNIMEHIYVKSLNGEVDIGVLNKLKFILYYFLVDAELETVELEKELVFYKHYIDLENFRHRNKILVKMDVLGNIEEYKIIPLLFEPLIGNALKYTKHDGTGFIDIKIDATEYPQLDFFCSNNCSFYSQNVASSESGLKIFEQRLNLCYNNKHSLTTTQEGDLYNVRLSINVE